MELAGRPCVTKGCRILHAQRPIHTENDPKPQCLLADSSSSPILHPLYVVLGELHMGDGLWLWSEERRHPMVAGLDVGVHLPRGWSGNFLQFIHPSTPANAPPGVWGFVYIAVSSREGCQGQMRSGRGSRDRVCRVGTGLAHPTLHPMCVDSCILRTPPRANGNPTCSSPPSAKLGASLPRVGGLSPAQLPAAVPGVGGES